MGGDTTLFDLEARRDVLTTQDPPNSGTLNTVGPLGVDANNVSNFDISGATGDAYATIDTPSGTSLHAIDLATGAATSLGIIKVGGSIVSLRAMAISPN